MPPEKLTGTGSNMEWASFEQRDAVFENMRKKAVKSIDPVDLMSIELNTELLDKNLNYNFDDPGSELSSVVKNVIWGLWSNEDVKKNLFPKHLLPKEDEKEEDKKPDEYYDKLLEEFIIDKEQHKTPVGRSLINFVILSIRSGFKGMSLKRRIEEHIAQQFEYFLERIFEGWQALFKNPIKELSKDEVGLRLRLLGLVKNSENLHTEIFTKYTQEGSMNVYGYFLRHLLKVKQAGAQVKGIMVEVIDRDFNNQRKKFLELLDKIRTENKEKVKKEREIANETLIATQEATGTRKTVKAAHVSAPGTIPEQIIESDSAPDPEIASSSGFLDEEDETTTDPDLFSDGGEVTLVDPKRIPAPPKPKIAGSKSPSEYLEQTREVTKPNAPLPDKLVEPQPAIDDAPEALLGVTHPVIPPMPKQAAKELSPVLKRKITELSDGDAEKPKLAVEPAAKVTVEVDGENITVPALPSFDETKYSVRIWKYDEKLRRAKHWIADNPKKVAVAIAFVVLSVVGGIAYVATREDESKKEKDRIAAKSTTDDQSKKVIKDLPKDKKKSAMQAPMHMEPTMAPTRAPAMAPAMKAPIEVMKASKDLTGPRSIKKTNKVTPASKLTQQQTKVVAVKGAMSNPKFANIDTNTIDDLPDGTYKQMWQGKKFKLNNVSYSEFLQNAYENMINKLPRRERYKAKYAYKQERRKLEKGWLIYNKLKEKKLVAKALTKEGLTEKEAAQLKDWSDYQDSHRGRARQARRLLSKYERAMKSKKKGRSYKKYKDLLARGVELMEFPGLNHLQRSADNILPHEEVSFTLEDGRALKTNVRFALAIKKKAKSFPMPDLVKGKTTGSIDEAPTHVMFAETGVDKDEIQLDESDMLDVQPVHKGLATTAPEPPKAFGSAPLQELKPVLGNMLAKKPPRIPKDARVYKIEDQDIIEERMQRPENFGSNPLGEFKPVLAKMMADRKRPPAIPEDALPKIQDEDILEVHSMTPPPMPVEDNQIVYEKKMAPIPKMYGSAPLPKEIKPILGVKPPAIPADAKPSVYDIPRGEGGTVPSYVAMTDDRMPKVGPPPIPAQAAVVEKPQKKSLWGRATGWLKRKTA